MLCFICFHDLIDCWAESFLRDQHFIIPCMRALRLRDVKWSFHHMSHRVSQGCGGTVIQPVFTRLWLFMLHIVLFLYWKFSSLITIYTLQDKIARFLKLWSPENPLSNSLSIYLRWLNTKSIHSREFFPDLAKLGGQGKVFLHAEV